MKLNNGREAAVYSDGTVYADKATAAIEMTAAELYMCNMQQDKHGRYYFQKGGQKRVYLDDAVITDRYGGITVKEYLADQQEYEVTITYKVKVTAPDEEMASVEAAKKVLAGDPEEITVRNVIDDIAQRAFDLGPDGHFVVPEFGKHKDLALYIYKDAEYDEDTDEGNLVDIVTKQKQKDGAYKAVDDIVGLWCGGNDINEELIRLYNYRDFKTL